MVKTAKMPPAPFRDLMEDAGHSLNSLADASGIPYSTLRRKLLNNPTDLRVNELLALADVLNKKPGAIIASLATPAKADAA